MTRFVKTRLVKTARALNKYGVVVVPVYATSEARQRWEDRVWAALDEMPEYKVKGKTAHRVLGGFGAYGNPSSFHHPTIQTLRQRVKKNISMPLFRALAHELKMDSQTRLEMLFDRVCVRYKKFKGIGGENWHRDIYDGPKYDLRELPKTLNGGRDLDDIFGGWLNLSDQPTYFMGLVQSHRGTAAQRAQEKGGGFERLSNAEIRAQQVEERLEKQGKFGNPEGAARRRIGAATVTPEGFIEVPPGHMVIFYQRLLHAVKGGPGPEQPQLRLFIGHRLTSEENSLFPLREIVNNNAVPTIPSGQTPPMYSQNHYKFFSEDNSYYQQWAGRTFHDKCLYQRKTPSGKIYFTPGSKDNRDNDANTNRAMPSLAAMGLPLFAYSRASLAAMQPELLLLHPRGSGAQRGLSPNQRVVIHSLEDTRYNGLEGQLIRFDKKLDRWRVRVQIDGEMRKIAVQPKNLKRHT